MPVPSKGHYGFHSFRLLTDFVCLYNYEVWLSLCKIVRSSVILLLSLFEWYTDAMTTLLTTTNICDTNDHGYFPLAVISLFMRYNQLNKNNTKVSLEEWELLIFLEHIPSLTVVSGVRVAHSLVFFVLFCRSLFVLLSFFFWQLDLLRFTASKYILWYLQTFLPPQDNLFS